MSNVEHSGLQTPYILSDMELVRYSHPFMWRCGRPNVALGHPKSLTSLCGYDKNCSNVSLNSEVLAISKCHCLASDSRVIWSSEFVVIFKVGILFAPHINIWPHCVPRNCWVALPISVLCCAVLYCTVVTLLYCTVLYCTVLYCTVLYCTVLYCNVLYCTALYCTVLYCTVLYCTVPYCIALYCTVLYCIVLYCTVLYYTVLYCTVQRV